MIRLRDGSGQRQHPCQYCLNEVCHRVFIMVFGRRTLFHSFETVNSAQSETLLGVGVGVDEMSRYGSSH